MLRKKNRFLSDHDEDPMAGSANLVDAMLVLAVGFLIVTVLSFNMQSIVFSSASPEEKRAMMETVKEVVQVKMGKELNQTPNIESGEGSGYVEMGMVYKDPETGKLILIPP